MISSEMKRGQVTVGKTNCGLILAGRYVWCDMVGRWYVDMVGKWYVIWWGGGI